MSVNQENQPVSLEIINYRLNDLDKTVCENHKKLDEKLDRLLEKSIQTDLMQEKHRVKIEGIMSDIREVKKHKDEEIDINLDLFREMPWNNTFNSPRWYFHIAGEQTDLSNPYLDVVNHSTIKKRIYQITHLQP